MRMDSEIMVEALPLLGVCNLCLNEGAVQSMLVAHELGSPGEIYADMLMKCFAIDITLLEYGDTKRLICKNCANKLSATKHFRLQVECSLAALEASYKIQKETSTSVVKEELDFGDGLGLEDYDVDLPDDDSDKDYKIPIKLEQENGPVKKLKKTKKLKKKTNDTQEIEAMLEQGLFPFKIKRNQIYSCTICPHKSTVLEQIKSHINQHTKNNIQIAFKKMMSSDSHRFYKTSTKLRCKICTSDVSNFEELNAHIQNCTRIKHNMGSKWNNLPFKLEKDQTDCPVCKKRFLNFVNLNTHMNIHYPDYICESCGKAFASKARLRGHMRTHEEGSFPCRYCSAVFDRVTKRENHVSKEHKAGVRYACKRCNLSLTSFYARQKHLAEVHNEELKRYKCKACPQSYITPGHLSSHVRRDHLNERNHRCDKCDLAFYTKNALKMHQIKHDGERIHVCSICQKSYQRKKTLREHMRIHNNDKRFICPVCGRAFTQKCTLKGHLRVHDRKVDLDDAVGPQNTKKNLFVVRVV